MKNSLNKCFGWLMSINLRETIQINSISDATIHCDVKQINHSYNLSRHWLGFTFQTQNNKLNKYTPGTKDDNGLTTYTLCTNHSFMMNIDCSICWLMYVCWRWSTYKWISHIWMAFCWYYNLIWEELVQLKQLFLQLFFDAIT